MTGLRMTGLRMTGLRRFARPEVAPPAADDGAQRCEMCGEATGPRHGHVADIEQRSILCTCRPCYLLFSTGSGRYRAIGERYLHDPAHPLTVAEWESLCIPVDSAFFLRSRAHGESADLAAFSPSPAGATQCLLDLDAWADLSTRHPLLAAAEPEVEAILVRCTGGAVDCFLVPVDTCYRLVGTVRLHWKGFDGGEARARLDEFFADVRARASVYEAEPR
ncbi:MAG TPA: DUF5947 family protein [Pseudonocardiaceae bacterium]|nr:DUF5947 family protein [Pseudonocardiaceae bacterium]